MKKLNIGKKVYLKKGHKFPEVKVKGSTFKLIKKDGPQTCDTSFIK